MASDNSLRASADIVSDLYVRNITMLNAENGARIKVFGGSNDTKSVSGGGSGYVRNVTFQDFSNSSESFQSHLSSLMIVTDFRRRRQSHLHHSVLLLLSTAMRAIPRYS